MARIKISIGIILFIITLCIASFFIIRHETNEILSSIEEVKTIYLSGNTEKAFGAADEMLRKWETYHIYASIFVNNDKISLAQNPISRIKPLIKNKNDELGAEFETAESALKWIIESEIPRWTNIL